MRRNLAQAWSSGWCVAVLVAAVTAFTAAAFAGREARGEVEPLMIVSGNQVARFTVEIADTDAARARGLMFRHHLPEDHGMLFDFITPRPVSMWMKNTYIPLDMLFIRADGTIADIAERTTPHSTDIIGSREPVRAVLELAGGVARKRGIRAGDRVVHRLFGMEP